jgi:hypothetical protein
MKRVEELAECLGRTAGTVLRQRVSLALGSSLEIIYQRRHPGLDAGIQCPRW